MNQLNFNSHPELTDYEFAAAAIHVFNGKPGLASSAAQAEAYIQGAGGGASGRYALLFDPVNGWVAQGYHGNADDPWFANVPNIAFAVIIPVAIVVAVVTTYRSYKYLIKEVTSSNGGNNGSY